MGYSKRPSTLKREVVKPILDTLVASLKQGERISFTWQSQEPSKLAYWIREAFAFASENSESEYVDLRGEFVVKQGRDYIRVEPRVKPAALVAKESLLSKMVLPDITTLEQAVGAAITHARATELYFPFLQLSEEEKGKLFEWCKEPKWYIIDNQEAGLTLIRNDPGELKWRPKSAT